MEQYYSNGKLLLTAEYVVLDGAKALALPTSKGQTLEVTQGEKGILKWDSYHHDNSLWFSLSLALPNLEIIKGEENPITQTLIHLLQILQEFNPQFLNGSSGYKVTSTLDFARNWGLGSSSTLITNLASWAKADPYLMLQKSFGGSGYDIACAKENTPITYQLNQGNPKVANVVFTPNFKEHLFFVHLNQKQNSRQSIARYKDAKPEQLKPAIRQISQITEAILNTSSLTEFESLIEQHEIIISEIVQLPKVGDLHFSDYRAGITKSLGGWGGDFILATGTTSTIDYFKMKGYNTIIPFTKMIL